MSFAILKSSVMVNQRFALGQDGAQPDRVVPMAVDPRVAIEAEVREQLAAEYQAKFEAAKEEARSEGYRAGLAEGHLEGHAMAVDAFKKKQALLEQVLLAAEEQVDAWLNSVSSQALDMAKDVLGQFIGEQALNPSALQQIIKRVTAGLREADVLSIRVHPTEGALLRHALKQAVAGHAPSRVVDKLLDDPTLEAGGVAVDTPRGEYRATLDVQLKRLLAHLDEQRAYQGPSNCHALRA